ncbi:hypothetical protein MT997_14475 [Paenibacillus sp. OVF10]|nr:hypothetical protein MT997_14475 [Paenibacillus sp. OVF10]
MQSYEWKRTFSQVGCVQLSAEKVLFAIKCEVKEAILFDVTGGYGIMRVDVI